MRKAFVALSMLAAVALLAQDAPPGVGPGCGRGDIPAPRNLKVIKPEENRAVMGSFVMGTGLEYLDCHVEDDFGSERETKRLPPASAGWFEGLTPIPSRLGQGHLLYVPSWRVASEIVC